MRPSVRALSRPCLTDATLCFQVLKSFMGQSPRPNVKVRYMSGPELKLCLQISSLGILLSISVCSAFAGFVCIIIIGIFSQDRSPRNNQLRRKYEPNSIILLTSICLVILSISERNICVIRVNQSTIEVCMTINREIQLLQLFHQYEYFHRSEGLLFHSFLMNSSCKAEGRIFRGTGRKSIPIPNLTYYFSNT